MLGEDGVEGGLSETDGVAGTVVEAVDWGVGALRVHRALAEEELAVVFRDERWVVDETDVYRDGVAGSLNTEVVVITSARAYRIHNLEIKKKTLTIVTFDGDFGFSIYTLRIRNWR